MLLLALTLFQADPSVRHLTLTAPERVLADEFSQIRGVRELRNGEVILVDRLDRGLVAADFVTGQVTRIGRTGRGPTEYSLVSGLIPVAGDSTIAIDEGNGRFALVGPDLRIHRTFNLILPGLGFPVGARGIDREGRYYLRIPGWIFRGARTSDTLPIVRYDLARERVDTLAFALGMRPRPPRERRIPGIPYVIYAPEDQWAVTADGRIAVVRSGDYHVEWFTEGRPVVRGPAVPYTPLPISAADRFAYTKRFLQNSPTSGREGGGTSATPPMTDAEIQRIADNNDWADRRPPFTDAAPFVGPDGTLWVERSVPLDASQVWDLFDARGHRTTQVTLPPGRRLAGLGVGKVYLVATDEDGLERVERYAWGDRG